MATLAVTFHIDDTDLPAQVEGDNPEELASDLYDKLDEGELAMGDIFDIDNVDFLEVSVVEEDD
jgi:hypothetical protein